MRRQKEIPNFNHDPGPNPKEMPPIVAGKRTKEEERIDVKGDPNDVNRIHYSVEKNNQTKEPGIDEAIIEARNEIRESDK